MVVNQWDKHIKLNKSDILNLYLTWINDYLTISKMSEDYGVSSKDILKVINQGRKLNNMGVK
jgi:hypothetical protein